MKKYRRGGVKHNQCGKRLTRKLWCYKPESMFEMMMSYLLSTLTGSRHFIDFLKVSIV